MVVTSFAILRQRLSLMMGDWFSGSLTSNGGADGLSTIDTKLAQKTSDDDYYINQWVLLTSGTYSGQARQVLRSDKEQRARIKAELVQSLEGRIGDIAGIKIDVAKIKVKLGA